MIPKIKIEDYDYLLPKERIAQFPLDERDSSRLLVYGNGNSIVDDSFTNLPDYITSSTLLVRNNTKVVPARLFFRKQSGAIIEILSLSPVEPSDYVLSFASVGECTWRAVVGNLKRWKENTTVDFISDGSILLDELNFKALLLQRGSESIVKFTWSGNRTFSEVLELCGNVPIPPYLGRESTSIDKYRYQTLYAEREGSVAAPTAGLHFTPSIFESLRNKGVEVADVCLHVGAGTFKPVKSEYIDEHVMHTEPFSLTRETIVKLLNAKNSGTKILSVGTTSTRTLESLYYIGVGCIENGSVDVVGQWMPYERVYNYTLEESLTAIVEYLDKNNLSRLVCGTSIIIVPGFEFKLVDMQLTNFHQPQSTLLLLIAALIGDDWKRVYSHALSKGYRFLSYGDASLLFRR